MNDGTNKTQLEGSLHTANVCFSNFPNRIGYVGHIISGRKEHYVNTPLRQKPLSEVQAAEPLMTV